MRASASAKAIATIRRFRFGQFRIDFARLEDEGLGILAIAENEDSTYFIYPDGSTDVFYFDDDDDDMSWHDECRESATF